MGGVSTHVRDVLGETTYESFASQGETTTTAAVVTYAYDQIEQAQGRIDASTEMAGVGAAAQFGGKAMTAWSVCGKIVDMASSKGARPSDNKSAVQAAAETAQAAVEAAQAVASNTLRIPRASVQIAAQLPDLAENLAVATERLNMTIDRAERYMALADPMVRAMDRLLPQLEALIATGNDVFKALSNLPGVSRLGRLVSDRSSGTGDDPKEPRRRAKD